MKKYNVKITEGIRNHLSTTEAYFFYCLALCTDINTMISNAKQTSLAEFYGIKDVKYIQDCLSKFEDLGFLTIVKRGVVTSQNAFYRNVYHLNDEHFVMISNQLYSEPISNELKGFLILFKCLCLNGTNFNKYSIRGMEDNLKIGKSTIQRHLKQAMEEGYIKKNKKGYYQLTREDIFIPLPESAFAIMQNVYPEILTDEDIANRCIS